MTKYESDFLEFLQTEKLSTYGFSPMFQHFAIMQLEAGEVTKAVLHYKYENETLERSEKVIKKERLPPHIILF